MYLTYFNKRSSLNSFLFLCTYIESTYQCTQKSSNLPVTRSVLKIPQDLEAHLLHRTAAIIENCIGIKFVKMYL